MSASPSSYNSIVSLDTAKIASSLNDAQYSSPTIALSKDPGDLFLKDIYIDTEIPTAGNPPSLSNQDSNQNYCNSADSLTSTASDPTFLQMPRLESSEIHLLMHIYSYLLKKSFHSTAQSLLVEAGLKKYDLFSSNIADTFLKEWWDIFWDVYQSKISSITMPLALESSKSSPSFHPSQLAFISPSPGKQLPSEARQTLDENPPFQIRSSSVPNSGLAAPVHSRQPTPGIPSPRLSSASRFPTQQFHRSGASELDSLNLEEKRIWLNQLQQQAFSMPTATTNVNAPSPLSRSPTLESSFNSTMKKPKVESTPEMQTIIQSSLPVSSATLETGDAKTKVPSLQKSSNHAHLDNRMLSGGLSGATSTSRPTYTMPSNAHYNSLLSKYPHSSTLIGKSPSITHSQQNVYFLPQTMTPNITKMVSGSGMSNNSLASQQQFLYQGMADPQSQATSSYSQNGHLTQPHHPLHNSSQYPSQVSQSNSFTSHQQLQAFHFQQQQQQHQMMVQQQQQYFLLQQKLQQQQQQQFAMHQQSSAACFTQSQKFTSPPPTQYQTTTSYHLPQQQPHSRPSTPQMHHFNNTPIAHIPSQAFNPITLSQNQIANNNGSYVSAQKANNIFNRSLSFSMAGDSIGDRSNSDYQITLKSQTMNDFNIIDNRQLKQPLQNISTTSTSLIDIFPPSDSSQAKTLHSGMETKAVSPRQVVVSSQLQDNAKNSISSSTLSQGSIYIPCNTNISNDDFLHLSFVSPTADEEAIGKIEESLLGDLDSLFCTSSVSCKSGSDIPSNIA